VSGSPPSRGLKVDGLRCFGYNIVNRGKQLGAEFTELDGN